MFGVFYYRSANTRTLETLREFLPVPVDELREEFAAGATPDSVCARSIRELTASGVRHFYVSNLPIGRAASTLARAELVQLAVRSCPRPLNARPCRCNISMGEFLDSIPFSGIIRIRDMMYTVKDPFRLDQGT